MSLMHFKLLSSSGARSECVSEWVSLCVDPKRNTSPSYQPSVSKDGILIDIQSQMLWGLFFPTLLLWAQSQFLTGKHGCRTSPLYVLPLLPALTWLLLDILSYKNSAQLVFRWISRMVVLQFNCYFDVIVDQLSTALSTLPSWPGDKNIKLCIIVKKKNSYPKSCITF